ncbi:MAG: hypothetical protein Q8P31_03105 [Bacillota bacterium]|nr:hypothetical protein [Bacillota bacterium]
MPGWFGEDETLRLVHFAPVAERIRDALTRPDQVHFKAYRRNPDLEVTRRLI